MSVLDFNPVIPEIMHIDLNSCFATIEQQANPLLRGKAIAVCAYTTPNGCILAPSVEAKRFGVRTGMRVKDGKALCPGIIILSSDPWKYRNVHLLLRKLLSEYTPDVTPKSIDEFVLDFKMSPCKDSPLKVLAVEIKKRIKKEIGEWLTVSIGIAPNRFLAKLASGLNKPDGLDEINKNNFSDVYLSLKLTDLPYIKLRNSIRLNGMGIYTLTDFYRAPLWKLKAAFASINGYYWYLRLRGLEIDNVNFGRKSYGNSYALPARSASLARNAVSTASGHGVADGSFSFTTLEELSPILSKLVTKMSARLRSAGYKARGVHLAVSYRDGSFWHKGISFGKALFDTRDIYKRAFRLLSLFFCHKPVRELSVSCFNLIKSEFSQLDFFEDVIKKEILTSSIDKINERWGDFVIVSGRMVKAKNYVPDRISFGGVKELEEFTVLANSKY
jgi:DNA polymerase-4